jgi:hypothetical protein
VLLPVDAQASILSFLTSGELARFLKVGQRCQRVATMDRLWMPLLARHFGDVLPPASLLLLSATSRFSVLALTPCSVCSEILLPSKPRVDPEWSRYSANRSCGLCGLLCCASCHCRCSCLNERCHVAKSTDVTDCCRCRGWAHDNCQWCVHFAQRAKRISLAHANPNSLSIVIGAISTFVKDAD